MSSGINALNNATNMSTNRITRNSQEQKVAEGATANTPRKSPENGINTAKNLLDQLDIGFVTQNNPSFQANQNNNKTPMASMLEISQGNFYQEAFENLSMDEKFSVIFSELYKIRQKVTSFKKSNSVIQQRLDTHDNVFQSGEDKVNDKINDIDRQAEQNKNSIIDIHNVNYAEGEHISAVEESLETVARDLHILKGTAERQQKQISTNQNKITSLTARSMNHNITISGLIEQGRDENCKMTVMDFLRDEMRLRFDQGEIKVAHRIGFFSHSSTRLMVAKVNTRLKEIVMANTSVLKGKTNAQGDKYCVNLQIPEAILAEKKAIQYEVKKIKDQNEDQPKDNKIKFAVKNKQLYVNNELFKQQVVAPRPLDLFVDRKEQQLMDEIDFTVSRPKSSGGSQFIGLAARVHTVAQTQRAYRKVRQMYPSYDHAMLAYEISSPEHVLGYQDDGEHSASLKMHSIIKESNRTNMAVFVVRNFRGLHLGPKRFENITAVSRQAMDLLTDVETFENPPTAEEEPAATVQL